MEWFLTQEGLNMISVLLVLAAAGYAFYSWITAKIDEEDEAAAKANALENPPRYPVKVGHVADLLASMDALRQPLPYFRKIDSGQLSDDMRDAADLARDASKSLRNDLP